MRVILTGTRSAAATRRDLCAEDPGFADQNLPDEGFFIPCNARVFRFIFSLEIGGAARGTDAFRGFLRSFLKPQLPGLQ